MDQKIFVVCKKVSGYRNTTVEFTKYFLAHKIDTVESVVRDRYGSLKQYNRYEGTETEYVITECDVEIL